MTLSVHAFPKTHKQVFPPPFHPIIADIGSLFEKISLWLDSLLQPLVRRLPGYIQDTKELLKAMDDMEWCTDSTWVTCNVVALYTCIPHDHALTALAYHLSKYINYSLELREYMLKVAFFT